MMSTHHQLSAREKEILLWSCRGKTHVEIALIVGIAKGTIKTYLDQARYKLNVVNLPQACAVAVAKGILTRSEILSRRADRRASDPASGPRPPQTPRLDRRRRPA